MVSSDYYPAWLAKALLEDSLPWPDALPTTMPEFLKSYTLHDSVWISLTLDAIYDGGGRAFLRWDTIWTDGRVPFPGSTVAEWPILIIGFSQLHSAELTGYKKGPRPEASPTLSRWSYPSCNAIARLSAITTEGGSSLSTLLLFSSFVLADPGSPNPFLGWALPNQRLQLTGAQRPGLRPGAVCRWRTADRRIRKREHCARS